MSYWIEWKLIVAEDALAELSKDDLYLFYEVGYKSRIIDVLTEYQESVKAERKLGLL